MDWIKNNKNIALFYDKKKHFFTIKICTIKNQFWETLQTLDRNAPRL